MKGLHAVCASVEVVKRDSYTGGSGTVFNLQVMGHGFNHTFRTNDRSESDTWPEVGAEGEIQAMLEPAKDGAFRLGRVVFTRSAPFGASRAKAAS